MVLPTFGLKMATSEKRAMPCRGRVDSMAPGRDDAKVFPSTPWGNADLWTEPNRDAAAPTLARAGHAMVHLGFFAVTRAATALLPGRLSSLEVLAEVVTATTYPRRFQARAATGGSAAALRSGSTKVGAAVARCRHERGLISRSALIVSFKPRARLDFNTPSLARHSKLQAWILKLGTWRQA